MSSLRPPEPQRARSSAFSAEGETVWTIVVAGGTGQRFGGPKQYEQLGDRRVLDWCVAAAQAASDGVVVVVPAVDATRERAIAGGATRSDSVRAGLASVPSNATIVCVHDGARPFASSQLFAAVVAAVVNGADAAVPGIPVADTIKQVDPDGTVLATPVRSGLRAVQTPQAFRAAALRKAHAAAGDATDDAALVEAAGGRVVVVAGEELNRKITDPNDLRWARQQLGDQLEGKAVTTRVGQGFDIHRFSDDAARPLVLGGVLIEGSRGLHGHSDADAIAHAVTDALLGAAGLGDIGEHFPDTDPQWKGADSLQLLRQAAALVRGAGFEIGNVDCSVVCEQPKLAPHRTAMQERLSEAAGAPVTVKGRRAEGLGALGREEGIAVWATAIITSGASAVKS